MYKIIIELYNKSKHTVKYNNIIDIATIKKSFLDKYKNVANIVLIYFGNILDDSYMFKEKNVKLMGYINNQVKKPSLSIMDTFLNYVNSVNSDLDTGVLDNLIQTITTTTSPPPNPNINMSIINLALSGNSSYIPNITPSPDNIPGSPSIIVTNETINFDNEVDILHNMGFIDNDINKFVLELNNGNIERSLDYLHTLR